jgi:hypothetical protein
MEIKKCPFCGGIGELTMDEKIEVNNKTVIDLAKIIHKHYQHIKSDWEEYTKSDLALAYAIKWNGYRKESDTAREICDLILEHWEKKQFVECDWLRVEIAEKYGVDLGE